MKAVCVLQDEISNRVEELLIIGAIEAIRINSTSIYFPQLEPHASIRSTAWEPSYVEELVGSCSYLFPSSLALTK